MLETIQKKKIKTITSNLLDDDTKVIKHWYFLPLHPRTFPHHINMLSTKRDPTLLIIILTILISI